MKAEGRESTASPGLAVLRRTRPRGYEEWKALRAWGRLPPWEPLRAGFVLRAAREAAGLTQAELAARLGVSQQAVARAEHTDSNPTAALIEAWARALGAEVRLEMSVPATADLLATPP